MESPPGPETVIDGVRYLYDSGQTEEQLADFADFGGIERLVMEGLLVKMSDMLERKNFLDEVRERPGGLSRAGI